MAVHKRNTFVLSLCGNEHAVRANLAVRSFKRFTKDDIVVIASRCDVEIAHDQVIPATCPEHLTDVQCSRFLKTGLHHFLTLDRSYCYVDTDVLAVSPLAAEVFQRKQGPVTFGRDPGKTVRRFSRYATRGIRLAAAIQDKFGIVVPEDWPIWNSGVYLFDGESRDFLQTWHEFTLSIFSEPKWKVRDQGTLVACVWKHGLQDHDYLPREFNWLHRLHGGLRPQTNGFRTKSGSEVALLHFPLSYGDRKYDSWTTALSLLEDSATASEHETAGGASRTAPQVPDPSRARLTGTHATSRNESDYTLLWNGDWHGDVAHRLAHYLLSRGVAVDMRKSASYVCEQGTRQLSRGIYLKAADSWQYALIDFKDMVGYKTNRVLREHVHDRDCRVILKGQYRPELYDKHPFTKIKPYTYFEKAPKLFQEMLPELRGSRKHYDKLYFRGGSYQSRSRILEHLKDAVVDPTARLDVEDYFRDCATARIGLALPGHGNICHREIEYFGVGVPTIMPRLKNSFHDPLVPDVHYISVDVNTTRQSPVEVAEAIREVYEKHKDNDEFLDYVARNAMNWYDQNVRFDASVTLAARLLGLCPGKVPDDVVVRPAHADALACNTDPESRKPAVGTPIGSPTVAPAAAPERMIGPDRGERELRGPATALSKTHQPQVKVEKLMVSLCLYKRQTNWPKVLDALIRGATGIEQKIEFCFWNNDGAQPFAVPEEFPIRCHVVNSLRNYVCLPRYCLPLVVVGDPRQSPPSHFMFLDDDVAASSGLFAELIDAYEAINDPYALIGCRGALLDRNKPFKGPRRYERGLTDRVEVDYLAGHSLFGATFLLHAMLQNPPPPWCHHAEDLWFMYVTQKLHGTRKYVVPHKRIRRLGSRGYRLAANDRNQVFRQLCELEFTLLKDRGDEHSPAATNAE